MLGKFLTALGFGVSIGILILIIISNPYDDSDNPEIGERSGFTVYTDHLTGCQYLRVGIFGSATPRLDGDKNQVGCR